MDCVLGIGLPIIIIALIFILIINSKRKVNSNNNDVFDVANITSSVSETIQMKSVKKQGIVLPIELLPSMTAIDEKNLFEITDNTVIARISETVPSAMEIAAKTITNNALKNVELYKVIIPSGATLTKSKQMEGAVRGYFHGAKGVKGQANLLKVDPTKISKTSMMANGVANVMNVGSLVVGQYYMSVINSKIESMSESVNKISDFQNREFKSRILALFARVGEISNFSSEILENGDLRDRKLQTLDDLKGEAIQLLQQVNLDIGETIKKNQKQDYKEYQESINSFSILVEYQQTLMLVLEEISKLTYLLGKGESSSEMCYSIFSTYLEQSDKIRVALEEWHLQQVKSLSIDIEKNRISKKGIEKAIATIPGLIDDNWKYKQLSIGLGQKINTQRATSQLRPIEPENVYDKDVQIVVKNGKYYYLNDVSNV